LLRRAAGAAVFDAPRAVTSSAARQYAPDHAIDPDGRVHLVWIDERFGRHVLYGLYDPAQGKLTQAVPLTPGVANWRRPTIALDDQGEVYVLFEQEISPSKGDIWFTTTVAPAPKTAARSRNWIRYK
jgi:hypothetical protein